MAILKYRDESGNFSPLSFIISVPGEDNPQQVYELPIASTDVLGGVKVDNNTIVIDENGVIKTSITSPTKVSELENDSRFITLEDIPAQGGTYTAGDGIKIEESVISAETRVIDITQANYDNLTQTQKEDPTIYYCIIDGVGSGGVSLPFRFGIDENGNYGYYKVGADTVTPFKTGDGNSYGVYISKVDRVNKTLDDFIITTNNIKTSYGNDYIITSEIVKIEEEE